MKTLGRHLRKYLTLRRQLGFKFYVEASYLRSFVGFARKQGAKFISADLALQWQHCLATSHRSSAPSDWVWCVGLRST